MSRSTYKPALSLMLASAVASVFTFSSFAASRPREPTPPAKAIHKGILGLPAGRLIGTGRMTVDGNEAQSGATVLSGSSVATGVDGYATIDLGSLGRIELQPNTTVLVTLSPNKVVVTIASLGRVVQSLPSGVIAETKIDGGLARLVVTQGQVELKSGRDQRTLNAGEDSPFNSSSEALASGSAVFAVEQGSARASSASHKGGYVSAGGVGIIALVGVAAAATGVVLSNRSETGNSQALPRPSTVVP